MKRCFGSSCLRTWTFLWVRPFGWLQRQITGHERLGMGSCLGLEESKRKPHPFLVRDPNFETTHFALAL